MSAHRSGDNKAPKVDDSRYLKWFNTINVSRLRFYLSASIFLIGGLILVFAGAITEPIIKQQGHPVWWKTFFSIVLPLTGVTILGQIIPLIISRVSKFRSEFDRMKAGTEYMSEDISETINKVCDDCNVIQKVKGDRWCRWLGPISNVLAMRSETFLESFFKDAKKIDILTPNLHEVFSIAGKALIKNSEAEIRMISLHPECSAVYRRFIDMGPSDDIPSRKKYSTLIREALDGLNKNRKKNWEIKTYTVYPVIMIFRADNRFLIGFPLSGNRVKEQFHFELRLPEKSLEAMKKLKSENIEVDEDEELGAKVRYDLIEHFDNIWENKKNSAPWMPRSKIFMEMLKTPLSEINARECCAEFTSKNNKTFGDLIRFIFLLGQITNHQNTRPCNLSNHRECMGKIFEEVVKKTNVQEIISGYHLEKYTADDNHPNKNVTEVILENFSKIIRHALDAAIEIQEREERGTTGDLYKEKLIEQLSRGISDGQFEFEDLAVVLYVFRKHILEEESPIWRDVWKKMEKSAENWAR